GDRVHAGRVEQRPDRPDVDRVQHHGGERDAAGVHGAAQQYRGGSGDHAGRSSDGPGWPREHGDRVHGERDGGDRGEPERRHAGGDGDRGGGERGGHVLRALDRQGGDRVHAGRVEQRPDRPDVDRVQHHGGERDAAGVHGAAQQYRGGSGDHAGRSSNGPGWPREHRDRVHRERDGGDRGEPERRHAGGDGDRGGGERGGHGLRALDRQGGDRVHAGRVEQRPDRPDVDRVQHHGGERDAAGVHGAAQQYRGGSGDHAGRSSNGPGWPREHRDRVHRERDGGDRGEPERRHAGGDGDRGGGERGGHVLRALDRQGGDRVHAGRVEQRPDRPDVDRVQHHGGERDAAGVHGAAQQYRGGSGDHAGRSSNGPGWPREHRDRVHRERDGGDRGEPERRHAGGDGDRGGGERGIGRASGREREGGEGVAGGGVEKRTDRTEGNGVKRHGGQGDAGRLHELVKEFHACALHNAGRSSNGPGWPREHRDRVHRERDGGDRGEPERRHAGGDGDRGGGER